MTNDNSEYNLIDKLNKIGLFFKYLFFVIITLIVVYLIYILSFKIDKLVPSGDKNLYKKAIINLSFSSDDDFKSSKKYLKNYNEVLYNRTNSKITLKNYTPIYLNNIDNKGKLFSFLPKFDNKNLYKKDTFYFFKHYMDETAYKRGDVFIPRVEELYSGKVVFESFFNGSYTDFINLVAGIILSNDLYSYKYSEQIKKIVFQTIKKRRTYLISSYNNKDSSTHESLIKAFTVYYKGTNLIADIFKGNYYLANELVANGRYFKFDIKGNEFEYNINFKEDVFIVFIFRDGNLIRKVRKLHLNTKLESGFYNVVVLKKEDTLFGVREVFWIYLNFNI